MAHRKEEDIVHFGTLVNNNFMSSLKSVRSLFLGSEGDQTPPCPIMSSPLSDESTDLDCAPQITTETMQDGCRKVHRPLKPKLLEMASEDSSYWREKKGGGCSLLSDAAAPTGLLLGDTRNVHTEAHSQAGSQVVSPAREPHTLDTSPPLLMTQLPHFHIGPVAVLPPALGLPYTPSIAESDSHIGGRKPDTVPNTRDALSQDVESMPPQPTAVVSERLEKHGLCPVLSTSSLLPLLPAKISISELCPEREPATPAPRMETPYQSSPIISRNHEIRYCDGEKQASSVASLNSILSTSYHEAPIKPLTAVPSCLSISSLQDVDHTLPVPAPSSIPSQAHHGATLEEMSVFFPKCVEGINAASSEPLLAQQRSAAAADDAPSSANLITSSGNLDHYGDTSDSDGSCSTVDKRRLDLRKPVVANYCQNSTDEIASEMLDLRNENGGAMAQVEPLTIEGSSSGLSNIMTFSVKSEDSAPKLVNSIMNEDEIAPPTSNGAASPMISPADSHPAWCSCFHCPMSDCGGQVCCAHVPELAHHFNTASGECVTLSPLFTVVVLDTRALRYGDWLARKKTLSGNTREYRHLAYNSFVNLVSAQLGKHWAHQTLPSCAVSRIRCVFPSPDSAYSGIVKSV